MAELTQMQCEACHMGAPQTSSEETARYLQQIPNWVIIERNDVKRLERVYKFKDFVTALAFTNQVGAIAEEQGHHPAILTEWGSVGVAWWTHTIGGLHRNDFIMAARTDEIYVTYAGQ